MLCKKCNNILEKNINTDYVKFLCLSCGSEYKASGSDSIVYSEDQRTFDNKKSGKTIWYFAANQKVRTPCPSCKYPLVAWELDPKKTKIYGCQCGYSWKHVPLVSDSSTLAKETLAKETLAKEKNPTKEKDLSKDSKSK